jgi:hypothetical protein
MKKLSYWLIGISLTSAFSTGCGKTSTVSPYIPPVVQQQAQYQAPVVQKFPPDSPDMSNPANSNLQVVPTPVPKKGATTATAKNPLTANDKIVKDDGSLLPTDVPELAPSSEPVAEQPEEPVVQDPWYKRAFNKIKSIFSKKS